MKIDDADSFFNNLCKHNIGPWINHSLNVAKAASIITAATKQYDPQKAYIYGLLHDIGRSIGYSHIKHIIDGFRLLENVDNEAALICITHSFPNHCLDEYQGKIDINDDDKKLINKILRETKYDFYHELIQLVDGLADSNGFVRLEIRWVDISIRNGINQHVIDKWKTITNIMTKFEKQYSISIYKLLSIV